MKIQKDNKADYEAKLAKWESYRKATYIELAKVNFDPEALDFETIDECIAFCEKQPEPMAAVMAIVCANIRMGEFGVASDVARQAETMAICCPDVMPKNR